MPLVMGKSPASFSKNVSAEMHAGKPQKQALAIAYSVKRRMGKKMSKGGVVPAEDMSRGYDEMEHSEAQGNEDLHPGKGTLSSEFEKVEHLPKMAQEHEVIAEPEEPREYDEPAEEDLPSHMFAHGGIAQAIMMKKFGHKMAMGGESEINQPDEDHFLSLGMPDQGFSDHKETYPEHETEHEIHPDEPKGMIHHIMKKMRMKHMGRV